MSEKPVAGPNFRVISGGKDTPSPSPRPAHTDQQARILTLEHLVRSLEELNAEKSDTIRNLRSDNQKLITGDIGVAARRIIFVLQTENREFRRAVAQHDEERENLLARAEASEAEYARLHSEYEKLLESYEERLSAESLVEFLNDELNAANAELSAKREELANYKSAESVKAMLIEELRELNELLFWDMDTKPSGDVLGLLATHGYNLLQSEDPQRQAFGFKLQSFVFEHQSKKRGTI